MALAAPRICTWPGCNTLVRGTSRCERHQAQDQREQDQRRGSAYSRGYDSRWRRARLMYLRRHPLCRYHEQKGLHVAATVVDHVIPHKGDDGLFWDETNWQALCKTCHDVKTATEDGGFGRDGGGGIKSLPP